MNRKSRPKFASEMTAEELERLTADLDDEFVAEKARPLSPEQRRWWQTFKRKMGRPKRGAGAKVISLTVERTLLAQADRFAKKRHMTRAALVDQALRAMLKTQRSPRRKTGT